MKIIKYISLLGVLIFSSLNHSSLYSSLFGDSGTINAAKMRQDFIQNAKNGNIKELKKGLNSNPAFRNMVYNEKTINQAFKTASVNHKDKAVKILLDTNKVSESTKKEVAKLLKAKAKLDATRKKIQKAANKANRQLLITAAKTGNLKQVKELLDKKGIDKDTFNKALSEARLREARLGHGKIGQILSNKMRSKGWPI